MFDEVEEGAGEDGDGEMFWLDEIDVWVCVWFRVRVIVDCPDEGVTYDADLLLLELLWLLVEVVWVVEFVAEVDFPDSPDDELPLFCEELSNCWISGTVEGRLIIWLLKLYLKSRELVDAGLT